ncbi:MAG: hypothetical protein ACRDSZ_07505 [Pseudonocardiaceae bacterium]
MTDQTDQTDQTDLEDDHQQQRSVVVPVASARRGVEYLVAEAVVTAGFVRAAWPESVPVPDLTLPLATMEPGRRGDRAAGSGGARRVTIATGGWAPDSQFPTTISARQRLSGSGPLITRGGGGLDSHRRAGESGAGALRWGRCLDDGCLHLLPPAAVAATTTAGHAPALCGRPLAVEGLTLTHGLAGPRA